VKRRALIKHFGSLDAIQKAGVAELMVVPGISQGLATQIREHFARLEQEQENEE